MYLCSLHRRKETEMIVGPLELALAILFNGMCATLLQSGESIKANDGLGMPPSACQVLHVYSKVFGTAYNTARSTLQTRCAEQTYAFYMFRLL